jgi:hypothetical protein
MLTLHDYDNHSEQRHPIQLPSSDINKISFGYDRGRISVSINGETIYENNGGASDFTVEIDRVEMPQPRETVSLKSRCDKCNKLQEQFIPFSAFTPIGFGEFCFGVTQVCSCGQKHEIRIQTRNPRKVRINAPKFQGCRLISAVPFTDDEDSEDE